MVRLYYRTATAAFAALCANTIGIRSFCLHPGRHGGEGAGIFFVVFITLVAICVVPMIALESVLGQFRHGGETRTMAMRVFTLLDYIITVAPTDGPCF